MSAMYKIMRVGGKTYDTKQMATAQLQLVIERCGRAVTAKGWVKGLHSEEEGDVDGGETGLDEASLVLVFFLVALTEGTEMWSNQVGGVHDGDGS